MKKTFTTFLLLLSLRSQLSFSQNPDIKRTMHWYFGWGAGGVGLDFSSGSPVVDTTGNETGPEFCFTMSDTCGNLLFYAGEDSLQYHLVIWNKNHQIMQNGLIASCCNPTQAVCV